MGKVKKYMLKKQVLGLVNAEADCDNRVL